MRAPGGDGVGFVQPHGRADRLPELVDVGLAEHGLGPARVRAADDRPGELSGRDELELARAEILHARLRDALLVEAGQEVGLGVPDEEQDGTLPLGDVVEPREQPRRSGLELVLGPVLDHGAADVRVGDVEVDPARPDAVGRVGHGPRQLEVLGVAVDVQVLAGLEIHADLHGQPRVALEQFVRRHDSRTIVAVRLVIAVALFVVPSAPAATGLIAIGDFGVGGERQQTLGAAVQRLRGNPSRRSCWSRSATTTTRAVRRSRRTGPRRSAG